MSGNNLAATVPTSPAVWTDTGELRMEWRVFFGQLWQRTGGSQGGAVGTGTITGVNAGAGLTGGGGSGVVTLSMSFIAPTPPANSDNTQIATTAYVDSINSIGWG